MRRLDQVAGRQVVRFLEEHVASGDPRRLGYPLQGGERELWRYRVGDYRLLCQIEN
ncbi:MAG: type II toxin-antitoxin system RelE family toxin [Pseudomonadota bacterium]